MLSERTLSESDLESLDISSYYNGSNDMPPPSPLKKRSLRSYCYCCF